MTAIDFSKKVLLESLGKELSDDEIIDRIVMLGVEVDGLEGDIIECDVPPNRPDLLSQPGINRAMKSFLELDTGLINYEAKSSDYKVVIDNSVKEVRPATCCAVVKGLNFDDEKIKEIIQIQEKLHVTFGRNRKKVAIGVYPMEKITFPVKFVGRNPKDVKFVPLEMDREIDGLQVLSKHPTGRDYAHLLEGKDVFPFFIDGNDEVMSMPPVINSHNVGKIGLDTKEVFVECSGFDKRILSLALNMIVTSLADIGGEIYEVEVDYYGDKINYPDLSSKELCVEISYVNKRTGLELSSDDVKVQLEKMGYGVDVQGDKVCAKIPCYRTDILHSIDLIEDIAIAYGYENFESLIPNVSTIGQEDPFESFQNKIVDILIGHGLIEAKSFNLIGKDNATKNLLSEFDDLVELINSVTIEYDVLRHDILPSSLITLRSNRHHEYPQQFFEVGKVFRKNEAKESKADEFQRLCVTLSNTHMDFTRVRQILDGLFLALDVEFELKQVDDVKYIPGRSAEIFVGDKSLGMLGEVHPKVLRNFDVGMPTAAMELDLDTLFNIVSEKNN